mgnify:CR=1 FL=1
MRRVWIRNVKEGQILALPVTNAAGVTVVQKGLELTSAVIERLKQLGVQRVFVEDPAFEGVDAREGLDSVTYSRLSGFLERMAIAVRDDGVEDLSAFSQEVVYWTRMICEALEKGPPSFLLYPNEGDLLRRWIARTVNVALLGAKTYLNIGGRDQARWIATAALLMDLGLWRLDEEILADLLIQGDTARSEVTEHVGLSLRCVRSMSGLSSFVTAIVAQHHERCDGTGYPKRLRGPAIHPLAKVMAVVDSFVSATQREKDPLLPHDALEWLMAGVGFEFDHAAVKAFRNAIHPYPVGMEVELDSGERGVVTGVRGVLLSRPCVRVVWDAEGNEVNPHYEVDLSVQMTKSIRRVL